MYAAIFLVKCMDEELFFPRHQIFALNYAQRPLMALACSASFTCKDAPKRATREFYRAGLDNQPLDVGMMLIAQFFEDRLNRHLHIHALIADGAFDSDGNFYSLAMDMEHDIDLLNKRWVKMVLDALVKKTERQSEATGKMLTHFDEDDTTTQGREVCRSDD